MLFRSRELAGQLVDRIARGERDVSDRELGAFLALFDVRREWRDVDRLALGGVLNEALFRLPPGHALEARSRALAAEFSRTRGTYNRELTAAFSAVQAPPRRSDWDAYLKFLRERYPVARVLEDLRPYLLDPGQATLPSSRDAAIAERAAKDEWTDADLPPKTLLLTLDRKSTRLNSSH